MSLNYYLWWYSDLFMDNNIVSLCCQLVPLSRSSSAT